MATLRLENLTKRFGRKVLAVNRMNLMVEDREFVVFLGPSGCGKTTTLRMIAGLERVTGGSVFIDGRDVTDALPRNRKVSMVFQNYAVWPHMTVYDNISFALKLQRMPTPEIDTVVRETAQMVKIDELLERFPGQLSGGQQQRVALARALAVKPKIFLMDEPLSNLDAKLRATMRTELKAIHQDTEATSVFVTHDQSEAMSMADRIVIMKDGEVVQVGTPDDVYFRSADTFVAGFIGTPPTNFMNAQVQRDGGKAFLVHPRFRLDLGSADGWLDRYGKSRLTLGVRPEDILIGSGEEGVFAEKILVVEPQDSFQIVSIRIEGEIVKIVAPAQPKIYPGEEVRLSFKPGMLHFFDEQTGKRIEGIDRGSRDARPGAN